MSLEFNEPVKPEPVSKQKKKRILSIIIVCVLLVGAIIAFVWYISPRQRMLRAIEHSDYNEVVSIMNKNSDVLDDKTIHILSQKLTTIELKYREGEMDYETALSQIGVIKGLENDSLNETADQVQNKILAVDYSKKAYNQGIAALDAGEYGKAVIFFEDVIDSDIDNYSSAQQKKNEAVEKYRDEVLAKANDKAETNNYIEAISLLQASFGVIPDDKIIKAKIIEYHQIDKNQNIDKILSSAKDGAENGDLIGAIELIRSNIIMYDNDQRLVEKLQEYSSSFVSKAIAQVKEKENEKKYDEAIQLLSDALGKLPNNAELSDKLSQIQYTKNLAELAEKKANVLNEAENAFNADGYAKAIEILQSVPELKEDLDITNKIAEYRKFEPVSLYDLIELNNKKISNKAETLVDTFKNDYTGAGKLFSMFIDWFSSPEYTFYTNYKYSKLKGKCAVHEDFVGEGELIVYAGKEGYNGTANTPLYKIKIDRSTKPFEIDVDISGNEWITIDFRGITRGSGDGRLLCIDWTVSK